MPVTIKDIAEGTVFTFTRDLTGLGPRWTNRTVGTHFIVGGLSESGYTFSAYNTRIQRWDHIMAETWIFEAMRIIPTSTDEKGS